MIKKICFYIFLFFCLLLNIVVDTHIKDYFKILEKCFGNKVVLTNNLYAVICVIFAFISILIVTDILLVLYKKEEQNKGINFKTEDGTFGTANWMNEKEVSKVLGTNNVQGIILGKYNNEIVKLPFESYFNKNICVFGSSGSMKTIRFFTNKPIRTI
jgi:type IV secretory pathway TraG/TraD family ATPase VirD4